MATETKALDLKVGDVILDGIASKVLVHLYHQDWHEVYMQVLDGNGYVSVVRVGGDAVFDHFDDWTEEDWTAYRDL
jgi:hypothetical protein